MTRALFLAAAPLALTVFAGDALAAPPACSEAKMRDVRAGGTGNVAVDCQMTLRSSDVITKKLVFEGPRSSEVTLACNGATVRGDKSNWKETGIEINSRRTGTAPNYAWERPEDIRISGCKIDGSLRISGTSDADSRPSSRSAGHTQRSRARAPTDIVLENLTITTTNAIPLYVSSGVTRVRLLNSEIRGERGALAVYLDAESGFNELRGNYIHGNPKKRELIAIDGSSDNLIINNRFSGLNRGGIYIYRNCGERGTVRHNKPQRNQIINNIFYYNKYTGGNPSVYLGSRDGNAGYCDMDSAHPIGSGRSNKDFARYNVVMQNRIYKRRVSEMIRSRNPSFDSPNYVRHNQTVTSASPRRAGCFLPSSFGRDFLFDGQSTEVVQTRRGRHSCVVQRCDDGVLSNTGRCGIRTVPFTCRADSNNEGCRVTAQCPSNATVLAASAACNLEHGTVSAAAARSLKPGQLKVLRASDNVSQGRCAVASTGISQREHIVRGAAGARSVVASCKEHDKNGGDCHIRGTLFCRTTLGTPVINLPPGKINPKPKTKPIPGFPKGPILRP